MSFTKKLISKLLIIIVFFVFALNVYAKDPVIVEEGFLVDEETFVKYFIDQPLELKSLKSKVNLQLLINKSLEEKITSDEILHKKQIDALQPTWWMRNKFYFGLIVGTTFVVLPIVLLR